MKELILIYNAKSGLANSIIDAGHKLISPKTYQCSLCSLTYNNFGKKSKWSDFLNELKIKSKFLYEDQTIENEYFDNGNLPSIYLNIEGKYRLISSASDLNAHKNLDSLILSLRKKVEEFL